MERYEQLLNQSESRLLLPAMEADKEIERLQGVIKAQAGTILELQEAIMKMAKGEKC
jgi:hypothetical protein